MRRLRIYFVVFFILVAVPCSVLLVKSYSNLEDEAFIFYRRTAEGAAANLNQQLRQLLRREEERSYTQYRYVHVPDQPLPQQEGLNLSPLAAFPVQTEIPGILGYFQIDPDGSFHTPLLPDPASDSNLEVPQRDARVRLEQQLAAIVARGSLHLPAAPLGRLDWEQPEAKQDASKEERLRSNLVQMLDLSKEEVYSKSNVQDQIQARQTAAPESTEPIPAEPRREQSSPRQAQVFDSKLKDAYRAEAEEAQAPVSAETASEAGRGSDELFSRDRAGRREWDSAALDELRLEAEVDPFRAQPVDDSWIVFYRKVWWSDRRYIQGFVASLPEFVERQTRPSLVNSALPETTDYRLFYAGEPVPLAAEQPPGGHRPLLLYAWTLPGAVSDFDLAISVDRLPPGPGRQLLNLMAVLLTAVLIGGFWGAYRLSASQMELSQKKSDFVSAVSHELKTPLTSIRMYGEMLMNGWVQDEEKKRNYHQHIHDESERLSRLIQNVLRLAQLERNEWQLTPSLQDPVVFATGVVQRLQGQVGRAGFEIELVCEGEPAPVLIDTDALTQILINLIDNAIKFSKDADTRRVIVTVSQIGADCYLRVRDFGPGIPRRELKRIFEKFYRVGGELTRTTRGTGIGLALVKMLADAMGARIDVRNTQPGAEFRLRLPRP